MQLNAGDVLIGLYVVVAVMLLIVLYHVLFIVVDLRKILRRVEDITSQVEAVIMKPLSMADQIMEWVVGQIEAFSAKKEKKPHSHKHIE